MQAIIDAKMVEDVAGKVNRYVQSLATTEEVKNAIRAADPGVIRDATELDILVKQRQGIPPNSPAEFKSLFEKLFGTEEELNDDTVETMLSDWDYARVQIFKK